MSATDDVAARAAFLRSTSMPVVPASEPVPPSDASLDAQLLELFFDRVPMGVAVFGTDMRLERCNKTWVRFYEHYLGVPPEYVSPGRHLHDLIPGNEESLQPLIDEVLAGRMVRQAAHRVALPGTETYWDVVFAPLFADGRVVGAVDIVTDATDRVLSIRGLEARVATFSRLAAGMSVDQPLSVTLSELVGAVRRTTSALACSVVCWDEDVSLPATAYADEVLGPGFAQALEEVWRRRGMRRVDVSEYEPEVRRDFRAQALADESLAAVHPFLGADQPWQDVALVPLTLSGVVLGELAVYLAAGQVLGEDERRYLAALADQGAVAVRNSSLFRTAEQSAALGERHRLARELHDSVSQALFSMTLHARAAQRHLSAGDLPADHPVAAELDQLHSLTRTALAEMRALIFELRPGALAEEGLAAALAKHAAAVSARERLDVTVDAPTERVALPPAVEEHVYRVVLEALNNAVRHAAATRVGIVVAQRAGAGLRVTVEDDGVGFEPATHRPGHLGLTTMRDRAAAVGGSLTVASSPGTGTRVVLELPTS